MPGISDKQQKGEGHSVRRLYVPQSDSHSAMFVECLRTRGLLRYLTSPLGLLEFSKTQTYPETNPVPGCGRILKYLVN